MAKELPYLSSYKNLEALFRGIGTAKRPDTFTLDFLENTIGLKGSGDRPLVPFLRTLGFLDGSNRPTREYDELKNPGTRARAIAAGLRRAYGPLFAANENAQDVKSEELRGLISQVAGTDDDHSKRIAYTFAALTKLADFSENGRDQEVQHPAAPADAPAPPHQQAGRMRAEFHYNIQIHLPNGASEETYRNIFIALRETFR